MLHSKRLVGIHLVYLNTTKESLNNTLNELDISPVKVHSVATHSKSALGQRTLKQS